MGILVYLVPFEFKTGAEIIYFTLDIMNMVTISFKRVTVQLLLDYNLV